MPTKIIKGEILSSGLSAQGILKIIKSKKDFKSVKPKEIVYLSRNIIIGDGLLNIYTLAVKGVTGIITNTGGKTDHGTVIASEFGISRLLIPADKEIEKQLLQLEGLEISISDDGEIIDSKSSSFKRQITRDLNRVPKTKHKVMVNIGFPKILTEYPQLAKL